MAKSKDGRRKVRQDQETTRKMNEFINAIAHLIRAVSVLMDSLRGWF